jgi:hypothetical protein
MTETQRNLLYKLIKALNLSVEVISNGVSTIWEWDYKNNKLTKK